jgi:cytoskeletal protein RodZ
MTSKGKHSSQTLGTFYRDLAVMLMGIIVVGGLVFFLLYVFADSPVTGPSTTERPQETTSTTGNEVTSTSGRQISTTTTAPGSTTVPVRDPGETTVVVLNSIGLDGAAGRLTSELGAAGYQTLTPDDYEPELSPSRIWYREGFAAEAAALLEFIPGATVEALPDDTLQVGADIVMVLGTGYEE